MSDDSEDKIPRKGFRYWFFWILNPLGVWPFAAIVGIFVGVLVLEVSE